MDREDFEKMLEIEANRRNLDGSAKDGFIKENIDYVLYRSYGHWSEEDATARIGYLEQEKV